jgi:simple sugar transport system ATP-binding protein
VGLAGVSGNGQRELADVLAGLRAAESGSILFEDAELLGKSPREIIDAGIGYIPEDRHDEGIVPSFSIRENLVLKDFASPRFTAGPFYETIGDREERAELIERLTSRCLRGPAAGSLSGGNFQ